MVCQIDKKICSEDFMFKCKDNFTCIHQSLVHDGHEHCEDGSDEANVTCNDGQRKCTSRYSNVTICATYCDGVDDLCINDTDENDCNSPNNLNVAFVVCLIVVTLIFGEVIYRVGSRLCRDPTEKVTWLYRAILVHDLAGSPRMFLITGETI